MKLHKFLFFVLLLLTSELLLAQSDDCPAAELIPVFVDCRAEPSSTFSLTSFSTKNSCNGNTDDDGWFRFIAISPFTQVVIFSDQLANMAISAFDDCKTEIACVNERGMGGQEFLLFETRPDEEYFVQVYDYGPGGGGFLICITAEEEVLPSDCSGAALLCDKATISFKPEGPGLDDFETIGNDPGCFAQKENNAAWYYFEIASNSPRNQTLTFSIQPERATDFDFAIFGPNPICEALGAPIRCSIAAANCEFCPMTGLGVDATDASEGAEGDGFLAPLVVQPGEGYFLLINNTDPREQQFQIDWGGSAAEYLNCEAKLPCDLVIDAGNSITVCEEDQLLLNSRAVGNTSNIKYQWSGTMITEEYLDNTFAADPTLTLPTNFEGTIGYELTAFGKTCTVKDSIFITKSCLAEQNCPILQATVNVGSVNCTNLNSGSIQIGQIIGGTPPYLYQINNTDLQSISTFQNLSKGDYSLKIQDQNGCYLDTLIKLTTSNLPTLDLGADISTEQGTLINLRAKSNFSEKNIQSVNWVNIPSEDCPSPCLSIEFSALQSGNIIAILQTTDNCIVTDSIQLTVQPKVDLYIPTSFSPNGDGINDNFTIFSGAGISKILIFQIYDRWGNLLFQQKDFSPNDPALGWQGTHNGQKLASGVFLYYAELEVIDNAPIRQSGDVFLFR